MKGRNDGEERSSITNRRFFSFFNRALQGHVTHRTVTIINVFTAYFRKPLKGVEKNSASD